MRQLGFKPDIYTYSTLIQATSRQGDLERMRLVLRQLWTQVVKRRTVKEDSLNLQVALIHALHTYAATTKNLSSSNNDATEDIFNERFRENMAMTIKDQVNFDLDLDLDTLPATHEAIMQESFGVYHSYLKLVAAGKADLPKHALVTGVLSVLAEHGTKTQVAEFAKTEYERYSLKLNGTDFQILLRAYGKAEDASMLWNTWKLIKDFWKERLPNHLSTNGDKPKGWFFCFELTNLNIRRMRS